MRARYKFYPHLSKSCITPMTLEKASEIVAARNGYVWETDTTDIKNS